LSVQGADICQGLGLDHGSGHDGKRFGGPVFALAETPNRGCGIGTHQQLKTAQPFKSEDSTQA
jgi:hypothetical protein